MAGKVFTTFDTNSDVVTNQKTIVTSGLFANNQASLSTAFTGSLQTSSSKAYYYDIYDSSGSSAEAQFAIAWGHRLGSGSATTGTAGSVNDSAARAIYSQYRSLLLNPGDTTFTFANGVSSDAIYAINFNRSKLKDRLDPGNWQLTLAELSGSTIANSVHTGSNVKLSGTGRVTTLIDDSGLTNQPPTLTQSGRVFNVVSGSITDGIFNSTAPHYYGLCYPDMGIIILNARMDAVYSTAGSGLSTAALGFNSVTGSNVNGDNAWKLYTSISGAFSLNSATNAFYARNEETISSTHYFVRIKNGEYNYSNNPTFVTGSSGLIAQPTFWKDPKTYITTIGLYNDRQELLAVAKLSKPIQKSYSKEALIKVKLDF